MLPTNDSITLLFTKTSSPLSKVIMWGLKEPASHLAIDVPMASTVVHSDLLGLHLAPKGDFMAAHVIVDRITILLSTRSQMLVQSRMMRYATSTHADYDFGAFASLGVAAAYSRLTGTPFPRCGRWGNDREFLCTEVAYLLNEALVECTGKKLLSYDVSLDAMSPWMLHSLLLKNNGGKNEIDLRPTAGITF